MTSQKADSGVELQPLEFSKRVVEPLPTPQLVDKLQFSIPAADEIVAQGEIAVSDSTLYKMPERKPNPDGLLDPRLGVSRKDKTCETCGFKLMDCNGHFGYIRLALPVFHVGFHKNILQILQCICKSCARILLSDEDRKKFLKMFRNPKLERPKAVLIFRKAAEACKKVKVCPHCQEINGSVKKVTSSLRFAHDKYGKHRDEFERSVRPNFDIAIKHNDSIEGLLRNVVDDLNPLRALRLFERITDEDKVILDVAGRPESLIWTTVPVPPVCIRPSVELEGVGSNEDDITMHLHHIVMTNQALRQSAIQGIEANKMMDMWDQLQIHAALLIDANVPGVPSYILQNVTGSAQPSRGFVQRLKGKHGRFRGNLSGKRADFTGRTVITPDPNMRIDQLCLPIFVSQILSYPEKVNQHNIEKLRQCIVNGPFTHPGANRIVYKDGNVAVLKFGDRRMRAAALQIGDTVDRHVMDGDVVIFNRQPSLHRQSMMAHRVKVMPWRTFRFNECVCNPYNADFDGDEMNIHFPQTEEARAEALNLMGTVNNLASPKNGEIMICATQDFLTSAFVMTCKDVFYTRAEAGQIACYMNDADTQVDLPPPAIIKPVELWTGKQVFALIVRPSSSSRLFVNLQCKEKIYTKQDKFGKKIDPQHMCPMDGFVCFRNGDLISGRVGKVTLGGSKSGLFGTLLNDYSAKSSAACMNRLAKMAARHLTNRGFTIGIDDVTPKPELVEKKAEIVKDSYDKCNQYIDEFKKGTLVLLPGCNAEQTLEAQVTGILNNIRTQAGDVCMRTLHWHNSPLIMSQCGSKGSPINIAQMVACVGQQQVMGKRAFNGFKDRTLPHFPKGDKSAEGKGFVANSFFSGLSPTEFWFHTMAGREGLVDTAVKTADTGYMSRRLMKSLEDLYVHYDLTVRNAANQVIQFVYGEDGMDPMTMEGEEGEPLNLQKSLSNLKAKMNVSIQVRGGKREVPLPCKFKELLRQQLEREELQPENGFCSIKYSDEVKKFLKQQYDNYANTRKRLGLSENVRGNQELEYLAGIEGLTEQELSWFVQFCVDKYREKKIDPSSCCGAFGAQSIGEPGTQMTLKTFHFAGVASMQVTLGVPRIKEIINAAKNISTPVMNAVLEADNNELAAKIIQARLQKRLLGDVCQYIKTVFENGQVYISVKLDMDSISKLQIDVNALTVRDAILKHKRLKLKAEHVKYNGIDKLMILPPNWEGRIMFTLRNIMEELPKVIVAGIKTIERAVYQELQDPTTKQKTYKMLIEGSDLQAVMGFPGIVGTLTETNHIYEIEKILGIEAARKSIIQEINKVMGAYGMVIDYRHTMLLADCMSQRGEVLGITRFGIAKMKDSVLMLASFEKTSDHLFDAAIHGRVDELNGVSECIIMGTPMHCGTGLFGLLQNHQDTQLPPPRPGPILNSCWD